MRDMPQAALDNDLDCTFKPIQDGSVTIGDQEKGMTETFENLYTISKKLVPRTVVIADIQPPIRMPPPFLY